MYNSLFGRASDASGKAAWFSILDRGGTKGEIFSGFTGSQEFKILCAQYGIKAGTETYNEQDFRPHGQCVACVTDSTPSESEQPETTEPDTQPETEEPETEPDIQPPETTAPETEQPETTVPETQKPETTESEPQPETEERHLPESESWTFYEYGGGPLAERNTKLEGLTYATAHGSYPIVAPDEGINWERDLKLIHNWKSLDPDATIFGSFGSWEGDFEDKMPPVYNNAYLGWYYGEENLSFEEWKEKYLVVDYYYVLDDYYARESIQRLNIDMGTIGDAFCSMIVSDEIGEKHEYPEGYPSVTLSDMTDPPVEGAVLVYVSRDGEVTSYTNGFIVSYDIYGGTGQWANFAFDEGRILWGIRNDS